MVQDIALVFMAAGLSSRFAGKIKQFAKIGPNGETLIEHSVRQALSAWRFSKIVFIVGEKTEQAFKEKFGNKYMGVKVEYAMQTFNPLDRDKPWGTVDAVCCARVAVNTPFIVCNSDNIYGESTFLTLAKHISEKEQEAAIGYKLMDTLPENGTANRGIYSVDEIGWVRGIKEEYNITMQDARETPGAENILCSMNIWALHPETIDRLNLRLESFKAMHKGDRKAECLLPNELSELIRQKEIRMKVYPAKEMLIDVTYPEDEEIARKRILAGR